MLNNFAASLEPSHRKTALGIAQLVMLGELAVNQDLEQVELKARAIPLCRVAPYPKIRQTRISSKTASTGLRQLCRRAGASFPATTLSQAYSSDFAAVGFSDG